MSSVTITPGCEFLKYQCWSLLLEALVQWVWVGPKNYLEIPQVRAIV
jgi:hypothetical protein